MEPILENDQGTSESVGARLRLWRKSMRMKLLDVKEMIGVSQGSLSDLENNKSLPSAATLTQLCLRTDLNIFWLLTGKGPVTRKVGMTEDQNIMETGHLKSLQDKNLNSLVMSLIKTYQNGGKEKQALLRGFLVGADQQ
jgi:transcriptional regulator with XRE-family HTH domain